MVIHYTMTLKHTNGALLQEARHCFHILKFHLLLHPPWWFIMPWHWSISMMLCFKKLGIVFIHYAMILKHINDALLQEARHYFHIFSFTFFYIPPSWIYYAMTPNHINDDLPQEAKHWFQILCFTFFHIPRWWFTMLWLQSISMMLCFKKIGIVKNDNFGENGS